MYIMKKKRRILKLMIKNFLNENKIIINLSLIIASPVFLSLLVIVILNCY